MAEIVSAIPSSAGPFHWAAFLSSRRHAPLATWVTAWYALSAFPTAPDHQC